MTKGGSAVRYYHGGKPLTKFEVALGRLLKAVKPVERKEEVYLTECGQRVLAEDVVAPFDVPPFDRAAMDGYAVRAADIQAASPVQPVSLQVIGQIFAGDAPPEWGIREGACAQVATGAPIPKGADCVVPFEDTHREGDWVQVQKAYPRHANINERGMDIRAGERVLSAGTFLTPAKVGVLAALGKDQAKVYARPKIAILPTGSEIVRPRAPLRVGQIYDTNTYTVTSLAALHGCEPLPKPIVPDEEVALRGMLEEALSEADMVVFSAGSAVGERDLLPRLIGERGELLFHGLAVRPGRPTLAAVVGDKLVVNLPGFPASCLMMAYVLLVPVWRKLARLPEWKPLTVPATLAHEVHSPEGLRQFLTVRLQEGTGEHGAKGKGYRVESAYKESAAITSLSDADGFIVIPEEVTFLPAGEPVTVHLF